MLEFKRACWIARFIFRFRDTNTTLYNCIGAESSDTNTTLYNWIGAESSDTNTALYNWIGAESSDTNTALYNWIGVESTDHCYSRGVTRNNINFVVVTL